MPRYINPHVNFYVRADSVVDTETPTEVSTQQELRRAHDLGLYTVEELEGLLEELSETLTAWVENHSPYVVEVEEAEAAEGADE